MIIDGHAHIYPDRIAARASVSIGEFYHIPMHFQGTVGELLHFGSEAGVDKFLIHSVATTPKQVQTINNFIAETVRSHPDRFIGFATLHQNMEDPAKELNRALDMGLCGVKLHPDFQDFYIDDEKVFPIYEACAGVCPILMHTGDWRYSRSSPVRVTHLLPVFPQLKMICAHFGGFSEWDEAEKTLTGYHDNIWVDTSSSLYAMDNMQACRLIQSFGDDRVIFGTDYPMWEPSGEISAIRGLGLGSEVEERIFSQNLCDLLQLK